MPDLIQVKVEVNMDFYDLVNISERYMEIINPFDEDKLRQGLMRALEKRPVSIELIENAIGDIKKSLRAKGEREVSSSWLGELVMQHLRQLDDVAYVRFASVYKRFQDVTDFSKAVDTIKQKDDDKNLVEH